jgi:hypothetical protein
MAGPAWKQFAGSSWARDGPGRTRALARSRAANGIVAVRIDVFVESRIIWASLSHNSCEIVNGFWLSK